MISNEGCFVIVLTFLPLSLGCSDSNAKIYINNPVLPSVHLLPTLRREKKGLWASLDLEMGKHWFFPMSWGPAQLGLSQRNRCAEALSVGTAMGKIS